MCPNRPSRRSLIIAGGTAISACAVGGSLLPFFSDDDNGRPGGLVVGTVPTGTDPLVWINVDDSGTSAERTAISTLLQSSVFDDIPERLHEAITSSLKNSNSDRLSELVLIGTGEGTNGAAIVWANWDTEQVKRLLGTSESIRTESYNGYSTYRTGNTSVVNINDGVFTAGSVSAVQNVVDLWNDDIRPINGDTLDRFEGSPPGTVRFSFDSLPFSCEAEPEGSVEHYDEVSQVAGGVPASGSGLKLKLFTNSQDTSRDLATAVRRDLGLSAADDQSNSGLFPGYMMDSVSVSDKGRFVDVEYQGVDGEDSEYVEALIKLVSCRISRSRRE